MEFLLLILGLAVGGAAGYIAGHGRRQQPPSVNLADVLVGFLRAVRSSPLPRETVMAVERVVSLTYDPETAHYIHVRLEEPPAAS